MFSPVMFFILFAGDCIQAAYRLRCATWRRRPVNAVHFRTELAAAVARAHQPLKTLVLDAIGMTDIDCTGSRALRQTIDQLDRDGVTFAMARTSDRVRANLARSALLQRIGDDHLYPSVDEAVTALHTDNADTSPTRPTPDPAP